ncbi:MAG: hypothetical protein IID37_16715 [Planctomycetes bacterium]|nr:hypothetical protein [Planctomycetota bacterium]
MKQKQLECVLVVIAFLAGDAGAAMLYVTNPATGGSTLDLAAGETGEMSLRLTIRDMDTGFAFLNTFYDDDDNANDGIIEVIDWAPGLDGPDVTYSRTGQWLPYDISWDFSNEYGLIMGRSDGKNWGPGTYVIDTLTLLVDGVPTQDMVPVTFEEGARAPALYLADFTLFPWGEGLDGILPDYLDPGVGGETDPFIINLIPEPGTLLMLVACLIASGFGRRRLPGA